MPASRAIARFGTQLHDRIHPRTVDLPQGITQRRLRHMGDLHRTGALQAFGATTPKPLSVKNRRTLSSPTGMQGVTMETRRGDS